MTRSGKTIGGRVELIGLSRDYGDVQAVRNVDVTVAPGEFLTILGASGSGKTTTLMMIAGFVTPSEGEIRINGESILGRPPDKRNLGVVFQSYALFPHMNVADNVGFPLRMRNLPKAEIKAQTEEALGIVHLEGYGTRRIDELSGGQQQRVALARALVFRPPVLLMDEPLGALDRKLREQMQLEIKRIQRSLGLTVVYVTHDQEEALILSDRIAIMHEGRMHQIGSPDAVYERPATAYVADFLGESNFLDGVLSESTGGTSTVRLAGGKTIGAQACNLPVGSPVQAMVRPESIHLTTAETAGPVNSLAAVIEESEYLGQSIRYLAAVGELRLTLREPRRDGQRRYAPGDAVTLSWPHRATVVFPRGGG
ncbi:MAG: ABC transporter ATP-binding protein [Alphaproteobacteria bacterium]|nr:ABC transporter ATP-binding protein [Alphaproteobacteria bacterium]